MTKRRHAAVVGSPISHSLSPVLHRTAYAECGLDWTYQAIDVTQAGFPEVVARVRADESFAGLSVTMPLKELALASADRSTEVASQTRAANTLFRRDGLLLADNTDPVGIIWALQRTGGIENTDRAGVIGSGATARSTIAALAQLGFREVDVVARRAEAIADLQVVATAFGVAVVAHEWSAPGPVLNSPIVVSTVPVGVADEFAGAIPVVPGVLLDVVYAPWPTKLAAAWIREGGQVASGLEMLVGQAARQVELMTGYMPDREEMLRAGRAASA